MQEPKTKKTRLALIQAAERLFAQNGLGGVSVRDITRQAGARNESAIQYHFGGLDALMREVFIRRFQEIERARLTRLREIQASQPEHNTQALMEAVIGPMFESCLEEDGRLYAQFVVQLHADPRFDAAEIVNEIGIGSATMLTEMVFKNLGHIPKGVLATRLRRLLSFSITLTADFARAVEAGNAPALDQAIREVGVSLTGFLEATSA